jgi:hypothetical protein
VALLLGIVAAGTGSGLLVGLWRAGRRPAVASA